MKPLTRRAFHAAGLTLAVAGSLPAFGQARVPWGIAVETEPFRDDEAYHDAIARHAELIVPMNALKWATLRYEEDVFNFEPADEIIAFAEARGLPVHGHTLLWYGYNPDWLDRISSRRRLIAVLERHVERVMNRYRGRVATWDVVNEVVAHDPVRQGRWRDGVWQRVLGPEQVDIAFELAHAADPNAKLFLNDYDLEDDTPRARERQDAVLSIGRPFWIKISMTSFRGNKASKKLSLGNLLLLLLAAACCYSYAAHGALTPDVRPKSPLPLRYRLIEITPGLERIVAAVCFK